MQNTKFKTSKQGFNRVAQVCLRRFTEKLHRASLAAGWAAVFFLLLCGSFTGARAQTVISNPNQIYGTLAWNNPPAGLVGTFLNTPMNGMALGTVYANSVNGLFSASTSAGPPVPNIYLSMPYVITVQAGDPNGNPPVAPIPYYVSPQVQSAFGDTYFFATATSGGVVRPPDSPDVLLDFSECAGLIEVRFCDPAGIPVTPSYHRLDATIANVEQAYGTTVFGSSKFLPVRGGNTFNLAVSVGMIYGTDPFLDQFTLVYSSNYTVTVGCDEIVTLKFIVPPPPIGSGGGDGTLGKIIGIADVLGKNEHWINQGRTIVNGFDGPFGNFRYDNIEPLSQPGYLPCTVASPQVGTAACNSSGPFCVTNLLPSNFSTPPHDYSVAASFYFDLYRRYEFFVPPYLNGVTVPSAGTVDLGNTFVIHPGYVVGDIFLCGPDEGTNANSPLRRIYRASDSDANGDGIPEGDTDLNISSQLYAAAHTPGGLARLLFEGDFVAAGPNKNHFVGDYNMTLGGLLGETTRWNQETLLLHFGNVATPADRDSYINSVLQINNKHFSDVEIVPTKTVTNHHRYGLSQVIITFHANSGTLFGPSVYAAGIFDGVNFEGDPALYTCGASGAGTPISLATATSDGKVVLCIPEGNYTFYPTVYSVNPDGTSFTLNTLPPFSFPVGPCGTTIVDPNLVLNVDPIPECVAQPQLTLSGSVIGTTNVASITYTLNGNTVTVCNNCGLNPSFNFAIALAACDNTLQITATDVNGLVSSRSKTIHFDGTPPVLSGCQDISTSPDAGANGAVVNYTIPTALDNCDGPVTVNCDHLSGSSFPLGATEVTCTASDTCGNSSLCKFTVTVLEAGRVEHCALTQGFYGNPAGKFNGTPSLTLINNLLTPNPLVVGKLGVRSLTIPASDAATLQARLPAGKAPAVLPKTGDKTLATVGVPLSKNKFDNVLLGQTITLSLNVRLDASLLNFPLPANLCTQGTLPGPDALSGTSDDTLVTGDFQSFTIPASVLAALSNASLGILNGKVQGLLELANRALAGQPTGGASLSDINAAVDAINRGFDGCRVLVDCVTHLPVQP